MELNDTILRESPLFSGLTGEEIAALLPVFDASVRYYRKGESLIRAGSRFRRFGLVLEGLVQVYRNDLEGSQMLMATVPPGVTFGEALCYLGTQDSAIWAKAMEETKILWLSTDHLQEHPEAFARFSQLLAVRMLSMNDRIQILSKLTLREKLMTFFSQYARPDNCNFSVPFDRANMAKYLGTDRSALSRELAKMKEEGILDYYKNTFRIL